MLVLLELVQSLLPSTRLVFIFSTGNFVFARMNLKLAVFKKFAFDWEMSFHLCEVYHFQNLLGLEIPVKHSA